MEDLWDIKIFRKNLMIISIINILIFIFASDIKEINILWLIKLENVNSFKVLILLLISNIYVIIRYNQILIKSPKKQDYKILFSYIIKNYKKNIIEINYINSTNYTNIKKWPLEKWRMITIDSKWTVSLEENSDIIWLVTYFYEIYSNDNIYSILNKNTIKLIDKKELREKSITITFNNSINVFYQKIKYYIDDSYYFDFYLPLLIWLISIFLIETKLFYLFLN